MPEMWSLPSSRHTTTAEEDAKLHALVLRPVTP